jgi:hypothetical protein
MLMFVHATFLLSPLFSPVGLQKPVSKRSELLENTHAHTHALVFHISLTSSSSTKKKKAEREYAGGF